MIVVRVELWSAITGKRSEIARAVIHNVGGTNTRGNYEFLSMRGRDAEALEANMRAVLKGKTKPVHQGGVNGHARLKEHVFNLVAKGLAAAGYGK
jgi:hypothetical protein